MLDTHSIIGSFQNCALSILGSSTWSALFKCYVSRWELRTGLETLLGGWISRGAGSV